MSAVELEQFGQAVALLVKASFFGAMLAGFLGRSVGQVVADLMRWAALRYPKYRRWVRARNRLERLEHASWMAERRASIAAREAQR